MTDAMGRWLREQIDACRLPEPTLIRPVQELTKALITLSTGRGSMLFGMQIKPGPIAERKALVAECRDALRAWYAHLAKTDPDAQVELWELTERFRVPLGVDPPQVVATRRERDHRITNALQLLSTPRATLDATLRGAADALAKLPRDLSLLGDAVAPLQPLADEWRALPAPWMAPSFAAFAGHEGDYLGVLIDPELLELRQAPVVWYSREQAPPFTWIGQSLEHVIAALERGSREALGEPSPAASAAIAEFAASTSSRRGRALEIQLLQDRDVDEAVAELLAQTLPPFHAAYLRAQRVLVA